MASLEISDVVAALASTPEGTREFDAWIHMVMFPKREYILVNGVYYQKRISPKTNLLKRARKYTTNIAHAMTLIPKEDCEYDIRITKRFGEVSIKTEYNFYSCKAPTASLGICYLVMKIADKERYNRNGHKGPVFISEFMTQRDFIQAKIKEQDTKKKTAVFQRQHSIRASQLQDLLAKRSGQKS